MLRISRREGESIIVTIPPSDSPREIAVVIKDLTRGRCAVLFDGDKSISIDRKELYDAKHNLPDPSPFYFYRDRLDHERKIKQLRQSQQSDDS